MWPYIVYKLYSHLSFSTVPVTCFTTCLLWFCNAHIIGILVTRQNVWIITYISHISDECWNYLNETHTTFLTALG